MKFKQKNEYRLCNCGYNNDTDLPTKQGSAYPLRDIANLAEHGIPVSNNIIQNIHEGSTELPFEPDLTRRRGVDVADVWNMSRTSYKKLNNISINN